MVALAAMVGGAQAVSHTAEDAAFTVTVTADSSTFRHLPYRNDTKYLAV